jgi:CHAD domain-containing protein
MALDRKLLLKPIKKLRKLIKKLDRQPDPDEVHDLRTSTRRFEAAFEALSLSERGVAKSVLKDLRRCRKRAGKVRDMDVLTRYASTVHLTGEEDCRCGCWSIWAPGERRMP